MGGTIGSWTLHDVRVGGGGLEAIGCTHIVILRAN